MLQVASFAASLRSCKALVVLGVVGGAAAAMALLLLLGLSGFARLAAAGDAIIGCDGTFYFFSFSFCCCSYCWTLAIATPKSLTDAQPRARANPFYLRLSPCSASCL